MSCRCTLESVNHEGTERIETSNVTLARSTSPVKNEFFSCETAHGPLVRAVDAQNYRGREN
uniref:Uncharacterized protein n=1 Tax=Talaromyces marneffei PM1 TaxID=1077442 RepID=A0A093W2D3_TALMA